MFRAAIYLLIILALGALFAWIADRPGTVAIDWQGQQLNTSLMVAVAAIVTLVAALVFAWWVLKTIITSPTIFSRYFSNRRRDKGYSALSRGMIAASSGNVSQARKLAKESGRLLTNEPLVDLLEAQTSLLEGNRVNAREKYAEMLDNDATRLLALRGLYMEAEREGSEDAAKQYANEAVTLEPALPWAANAVLKFNAGEGEWETALDRLESNRSAGLLEKDMAGKQRAVLLTAQAFDEELANPERAAKLAQQAHKLDAELVPAAVIGARAYTRIGDIKRASRIVEDVWRNAPHPELADAYTHVRSGDSVVDRLKRANHLASLKAHHPESNMAIALAAIDANDWTAAREAMHPVITNNISERACLIMADIEEGEHGDRGRVRDWLSRAVRAPKDPVWTADGYVSENWLPMSPVTGEIGAFEWKVPLEQLDGPSDVIDVVDLAKPLGEMSTQPVANASAAIVTTDDVEDAVESDNKPNQAISEDKENDEPAEPQQKPDESAKPEASEEPVTEAQVIELKPAAATVSADSEDGANSADSTDVETSKSAVESAAPEQDNKVEFPLERRPDDPGVDPNKVPEKKKFKLF